MWDARTGCSRVVVFAALGTVSGCSSSIEQCPNGADTTRDCASHETVVNAGKGTGGAGASTGDRKVIDDGNSIAGGGATAEEVTRSSAMCAEPEAAVRPTRTEDDLASLLVGRWLHCAGWVVFGRDDTKGMRIDADGSWRFLLPAPDGTLVEGQGFDNIGTWTIIDTSAMNGQGVFQVNLDLPGIGGNGVFPVFAAAPPKMRWSTMLGHADYASLDRE